MLKKKSVSNVWPDQKLEFPNKWQKKSNFAMELVKKEICFKCQQLIS